MRAYIFDELKQPGGVRDVPVPECGPSEIRIRVSRAGVNPIDWKIRSGAAGDFPTPRVAGQDVAGVVDAVGDDVRGFAVGDRVLACARDHGGYAEVTVVPADAHGGQPLSKIPAGVSDSTAAAIPTPGLTALGSLDALFVGQGTVVLVLGAAGAVGAIAVQLAAKRGATVVATVKGSAAEVRALGADLVIESGDVAEVVTRVKDAYPDGLERVIDLVSDGEQLKTLSAVLKPGGTMLTTIHVADEAWFAERGLKAINFAMPESPVASAGALDALTGAVADGSLRIAIEAERPLDDARDLLDRGAGHDLHGKYIIALN